MFISQPPCFQVSIYFPGLGLRNLIYDDPNGVRFGGLYDAMSSQISETTFKMPNMSPIISRYSIQGAAHEDEESAAEIDMHDGVARWPENLVCLPRMETANEWYSRTRGERT
jgi:hypothetical protein